ncbi:MAG: hypothetical protein LBQ57_00795, partial [Spirochaetales bacterium]|nr:hypothetical protein [Spirochaetales bacterium]
YTPKGFFGPLALLPVIQNTLTRAICLGMQKTGLSASIFWLCQKDLRCNPWRGPGACVNKPEEAGDFHRNFRPPAAGTLSRKSRKGDSPKVQSLRNCDYTRLIVFYPEENL